jgi:hypothetical protein
LPRWDITVLATPEIMSGDLKADYSDENNGRGEKVMSSLPI